MDSIYEPIKQFIIENVILKDESGVITDELNLREMGILDSLSTLSLISFIERNFDLTLEPEDVEESNFYSIASIANFVRSRVGNRPEHLKEDLSQSTHVVAQPAEAETSGAAAPE